MICICEGRVQKQKQKKKKQEEKLLKKQHQKM